MRLFLYYTQSDLKQMAKLIDGWERGRGGGGVNLLGRSLEGRVEGRFFACIYSFKVTEYLRILKILNFFKLYSL